MSRRKLSENNIRKLTRSGGGKSIGLTLPKEMVEELKWKEKQKVIVRREKIIGWFTSLNPEELFNWRAGFSQGLGKIKVIFKLSRYCGIFLMFCLNQPVLCQGVANL